MLRPTPIRLEGLTSMPLSRLTSVRVEGTSLLIFVCTFADSHQIYLGLFLFQKICQFTFTLSRAVRKMMVKSQTSLCIYESAIDKQTVSLNLNSKFETPTDLTMERIIRTYNYISCTLRVRLR